MKNKKQYYGDTEEGIVAREKEHYALAREAAREGIVLLRNDGALPLKEKKVALYGMGAVKTVAGGTGSGSVNQRYSVNILEGLENAGITVTTRKYLDDCMQEFEESYQSWHDAVEEKTACLTNPLMLFATIGQFEFKYPYGREISDEDLHASDTDTAVYVLMRQAGEGNDRRLEKGDYYINDLERKNLEKIASYYRHTVVVINVGGMIDLSFTDEIKGIDGIVYLVQGGMEGGNALGELLAGKANFSGKLADSWAAKYDDIPFGKEYSYLNGNLDEEYYKEGVFVGYRYYDTFGVPPRYPFGFGLSYTEFAISGKDISIKGTAVTAIVSVKNTGKYAGKEVVQAYVSHLNGGVDEVYQQLAAFEKTQELRAGGEQSVTLSFDLRDCAVYCEETAEWILKSGEYLLRIGNSSRNTKGYAVFTVECDTVVERVKNCCPPKSPVCELKAPARKECAPAELPRFDVECNKIIPVGHGYQDEFSETKEESAFLDGLTDGELAELVRGGDLQSVPEGSEPLRGNGGKSTTALLHKGLVNISFVDGPAGLNIFNHVFFLENGHEVTVSVPERFRWKALLQNIPPLPKQGTHIYRYATAWPVELLLAQTWNTDILYRMGRAVGREMTDFGIDVWLAPGMNIHRNPLCGRNFEYYSEDSLVTGKMAAALVKGVQSYAGKSVALKHFTGNNQEDNRFKVSSQMDEKTLRQIYLKGFEIAVKEGKPNTIMSSYNRLNGVHTSNSKSLLTDILRGEWGFKGLVMTDWGTCAEGQSDSAECIVSGNDLIMPGSGRDTEIILSALKKGTLRKEELRKCAARVLRLIWTTQNKEKQL